VRERPKSSTVTKTGAEQAKISELQETEMLLSDDWQRDLVDFVSDSEVA
jgi:hypothetical protein